MADATRHGLVIGRVALSKRVTEVTLEVEGPETFRWLAGQHVRLRPDRPGAEAFPYSIASSPSQAKLGMVTLAVGESAELLEHAGLGARFAIEGPFGVLTWQSAPGALLVGAGTGVAPLRAIVHDVLLADLATPLVLVAGNREPDDLLWHGELALLAKRHANFAYEPVLSQSDASFSGRRGHVQDHLRDIVSRLPQGFRAYLCGSLPMVADCLRLLAELGVPPERILSEADS